MVGRDAESGGPETWNLSGSGMYMISVGAAERPAGVQRRQALCTSNMWKRGTVPFNHAFTGLSRQIYWPQNHEHIRDHQLKQCIFRQ